MEIKSKAFGEQQIAPNTIINFPDGIPGFENQTSFQLFHQEGSEIVFLLQSLIDEELAFPVAHPSHFNINYNFVLNSKEESTLEIEPGDDILILLILHREDNPDSASQPTIKGSIKSPIVINSKKKIGIQKLLKTIEQSITLTERNNEIDVSEV